MKLTRRVEYEILGALIRKAREDLGLTQRALARKLGRAETSISKIEAGNQRIDLVELADIAKALRINLADIAHQFQTEINK